MQQFTNLFQHYSEALSPSSEAESTPHHESDRLLEAERLAILEFETNSACRTARAGTSASRDRRGGEC